MANGITSLKNQIRGLPRRDALRAVASAALSATLGVAVGSRPASAAGIQTRGLPDTPPKGYIRVRGVVLRLHHSSGTAGMVIPEARGGRLRLPGKAEVTVVPTVKESSIELAIHDAKSMGLEKTLTFSAGSAAPQPTGVKALTGLEITVLGSKAIDVPEIHDATTDCCIDCAWGRGCGCAVCCTSGVPDDGGCCDSGCCPNCDL